MNPLLLEGQNLSANVTISPLVALEPSICIVIRTFFSIICIVRYIRDPDLRTHYTYIVRAITDNISLHIFCSFISI